MKQDCDKLPLRLSVQTACRGFWLLVAVLLLLRFSLTARFPAYIIGNSPHDDAWVVTRATYILSGEWFGPYDQYTLIKGAFSPLLLAACSLMGIRFSEMNTLLYCCACVVFICSISPLLKRHWVRWICLVALLFNPISFAAETWQRIYRNGMSQWQLLLILGSFIALYLRRNENWWKLIPWGILGGLAAWAFFNTREDGVWLYPLLVGATVVSVITCLIEKREKLVWRIFVILLPLLLLLAGNAALAEMNRIYYGAALRNDRGSGAYAAVVKDLYKIKPDEKDEARFTSPEYKNQYYNIYTSTMQKAYAASPTLNDLRSEIDAAIKMWDSWDSIVDGEPYADHILFAIRDGIAAAGYYDDLVQTEALYKQIHSELKEAFCDGTLEKRGLSLSALASPLEPKDVNEVLSEIPKALKEVVCFNDVFSAVIDASGTDENVRQFERISGDRAPNTKEQPHIQISGWAFAYADEMDISVGLYTVDGTKVADAVFDESPDVYEFFSAAGQVYSNANMCRFYCETDQYISGDSLVFKIVDAQGRILMESPIAGASIGNGNFGDTACYSFEEISITDPVEDIADPYISRGNAIIAVYQKMTPILMMIALLEYGFFTIYLFWKRKWSIEKTGTWLLLTGVLLSLLLFIGCMAYMTVTTFFARMYLYLSPAYVLLLVFIWVTICYWGELIADAVFGKIRKDRENSKR